MSVSGQPVGRSLCLLVTATLFCASGHIVQAAPASVTPKPQTSSARPTPKSSSKPSAASAMKLPTSSAAGNPKQASPPAKTPEKKTGDRATGNPDAWPPPPTTHPFAPEPPVDTSNAPPSLPRASRVRMRACAEEWTRKKLLSRSNLPRWREFATSCLSQKTRP